MTFLFTDLEGSTRLWQQYPEAMQAALERHDDIVRSAVANTQGQVVKSTGDGFHAVFRSAADGLQACIVAQKNLLAENWAVTGPLRVRMGLHMGEAQQRGGDYYGTAVNRAARLMAAGSGGQVLLSAAVVDQITGHLPAEVTLRDLGEHRLKDLLRPEHIYQLVYPGLPDDFPALVSLSGIPNNLPSQPTVFVGREKELADIKVNLTTGSVRLLTLTGPGGTGKTRLALQSGAELIDRFADGTYFVDLAPVRDPDQVLTMVARTIGLGESGNGSMMADLRSQLREKQILLLLDNFEQVTAGAVQLAALLQFCPRLKLLITSREALRVRGEHLYPVPPLGLPDAGNRRADLAELARFEAVQLFVTRAQAIRPDFELNEDNAGAIVELCARLDGLPLAIELAAARIRLFSPEALRQRLGSRLNLLRGGARDLPARQQTLRDTIDWSFELLNESEKRLFAVIAVFSGFTYDAVEAVAGAIDQLAARDMDMIDRLESLVDKSLIRLMDDETAEPQLRMLETIREFANERLQEDPDLYQAARYEHALYYAGMAQQQRQRLLRNENEAALREMAAAVENLKIAWNYWLDAGDLEPLQRMADSLWLFYESHGWYQDAVKMTTDLLKILSTTAPSPEQVQQMILLHTLLARVLLAMKGYTSEVEAAYKRALEISEAHGEIPQVFSVLRGLGSYYMFRSESDKSLQMAEKILALAEKENDDLMRIHGYMMLGGSVGFTVSIAEGLAIFEKGIALFDPDRHRMQPYQIGNNPGIVCYTASAIFLWWHGFPDRARKRAEMAMELARKLDHPFTLAYAYFHTGLLYLMMRELPRALEHALAMKKIAADYDYQLWGALSTIMQGAVQTGMGQSAEGVARVEAGIAAYLDHISPPVFWPDLTGIRANAYAQAGRNGDGLRLIHEFLAQENGRIGFEQTPTLALALAVLLLEDEPERSAELFQEIRDQTLAGDMLILALKAATSLCSIDLRSGNAQESGPVLAEIYGRFTEGYETADLIEARNTLAAWREKSQTGLGL